MKKHKWHKEIKELTYYAHKIERSLDDISDENIILQRKFIADIAKTIRELEYCIKPQPKEPQYLYVYQSYEETTFGNIKIISQKRTPINATCIGKIKLEVEE